MDRKIKQIMLKIVKILKKHGVVRAGIFGSYARGEQKKNSDIDILIKPTRDMSLFDLVGIKLEIEDKLGNKIDINSYKALHPQLKKQILKEEIRII